MLNTDRASAKQGIQSIEVGTRLLLALAEAPGPMMLRDLSASARMSASKAHRYLVSYLRVGLVQQEPDTGRYDLGALSLRLGFAALARIDAVGLATPLLHDLSVATRQTVALAVWANHGATIVRWLGADAPVTATLRVGSVMPVTRSATGRVFAAHRPRKHWMAMAKRELTENRRQHLEPQTLAGFEAELEAVRRHGVAATSGFIPGISGMAVPVFAADGALELALVALGHSPSFDPLASKISQALKFQAARLSARLRGKMASGPSRGE